MDVFSRGKKANEMSTFHSQIFRTENEFYLKSKSSEAFFSVMEEECRDYHPQIGGLFLR